MVGYRPRIAVPGGKFPDPTGDRLSVFWRDLTATIAATPGEYGDGAFIYQQFHETPRFDGCTAVLGSWLVNGYACGMGIREDREPITRNTSRFVPHLVL